MQIKVTRRQFLSTAALFSAIGVAPQFLVRAVEGQQREAAPPANDKILVVVQLGGGNDGLNMLAPYGDDAYYRARPTLALKKDRVLPLNEYAGLNGGMADLMRLYDNGRVALIQGVGYPNPDRSHFRSMEIWQSASDADEYLHTGWIGRYFDNTCDGSARPQIGVAVGPERPQAFEGEKGFGVAFDRPDRYGWKPGKAGDTAANFEKLNRPVETPNTTLDFLRHTTSNAILSSAEVREASDRAGFQGGGRGAEALKTVAALIRGGLATRVYYVSAGGFDTHTNQRGQHDNLLQRVASGLAEFQDTLERDGTADRVVTMVFSEFGRRVQENASRGTDHGSAAPMILLGRGVQAGLHGQTPSLSDLDRGDLKHTVDFRSVYATVLEKWLQVDSAPILGREFEILPLLG
ncbi:MAG: DUF1501 domain-containing protein [FCB group bacterium]|jgi:uncharacterized protein (DUF1501 family)|nr:DUF1501 domain-containing protein [FCB group bacterium]